MPSERTYRIVTGNPETVEYEVHQISDDYTPIVWNVQPGPEGPLVTCILMSVREMRKAALMQGNLQAAPRLS